MHEWPSVWAITELGTLIQRIEAGLNVKCEERPPRGGERGLVKISAVTWGRFDELQSKTLLPDAVVDERNRIRTGDLLISRANTIELVGASVIVGSIERALYLSDKVLRLVVDDRSKRWINHALKTPLMRKAIEDASSGNQLSMRNLSQDKLRALPIPLAPLAEQQRIADKLDTVLARVDACRDRLARVAPLLKRFRQSVLAAATSGKLTGDWRSVESVNATGLPLSWKSKRLRDCILSMSGGASPSAEDYVPTGVLALNKGDIKLYGQLGVKKSQNRVPKAYAEQHGSKLVVSGKLLVTLRDLSNKADFLGLIAQYAGTEVALPTQGMYALTLAQSIVPKYLMYFSNSPVYRECMKREKVGATQVHLRNDQFLDIPIALPSTEEQTEIVRRVETLFAFADRLEARLAQAQTAVDRLTPSLLAKAFRGELVPQDPADEPASELLRRLASDQTTAAPRRGRRKPEAPTA